MGGKRKRNGGRGGEGEVRGEEGYYDFTVMKGMVAQVTLKVFPYALWVLSLTGKINK